MVPDRFEQCLRLRQPPRSIFAAGHFALVGLHDRHSVRTQALDVAARRLVPPHAHVHRRRGEHLLVGRQQ
jgi:hypothetical protein